MNYYILAILTASISSIHACMMVSPEVSAKHKTLFSTTHTSVYECIANNHDVLATSDTSIFRLMIETADLKDLLTNGGPYTVFAPSDSALRKVNQQTLNELFDPAQKDKLQKIIKRLIIDGGAYPLNTLGLFAGKKIPTLECCQDNLCTPATQLTITPALLSLYYLMVNNQGILFPNIRARNGIIHIIDSISLE